MSYASITQCSRDQAFLDRIAACVADEAWHNPELSLTPFAEQAKASPASAAAMMAYPLSIDNEAGYEYALNTDPPNPDPGGDPTVITDAAILSGVQTYWPGKPTPEADVVQPVAEPSPAVE